MAIQNSSERTFSFLTLIPEINRMTKDFEKRRVDTQTDHPLDHLMKMLTMDGLYFTQCTLSKPWAISLPQMDNCVMFHLIVAGSANFSTDEGTIKLNSQELIIYPKGSPHKISDGLSQSYTKLSDLPIKPVTPRFETLSFGGHGDVTKLFCGALVFQAPITRKLIEILPDYITITRKSTTRNMASIRSLFSLINEEVKNISIGSDATLSKLADLLVITSIREHLSNEAIYKKGLMLMLSDSRIFRSIELMHNNPEINWSLERLSKEVGMSRTSFIEKFRELIGTTPIDYLIEWRMSLAFSKLQMNSQSILSVALELGYKSEASFSRAFKKVIGKNPGDVRRNALNKQIDKTFTSAALPQ